jgi:uncharacterized protein (DUF2147 family)
VQRIWLVLAALLPLSGQAFADDIPTNPSGLWLVTKGYARIRIENCNNSYWGAVAWEQRPGGVDSNNPDPSKRTRPTFGMPVLLDMKQVEQNKWAGQIYNSEDGKTYTSHISLGGPDVLQVRGCVLGILCGGEDWTRVKDDQLPGGTPGATPGALTGASSGTSPRPPTTSANKSGSAASQKPGAAARPPVSPNDPTNLETASLDDFCSVVLNGPGPTH